jgi:hypothetical protein
MQQTLKEVTYTLILTEGRDANTRSALDLMHLSIIQKKPFDSMGSCKNDSAWLGIVDVFQEVFRLNGLALS